MWRDPGPGTLEAFGGNAEDSVHHLPLYSFLEWQDTFLGKVIARGHMGLVVDGCMGLVDLGTLGAGDQSSLCETGLEVFSGWM